MKEELYIDGAAVDLKPDAATTLNFKSNLLGDISKITASNSQTIQCPKTARNRRIFDNPGAPAYVTGRRYKRYAARLVRNGVEVVRIGYAVLLSSSETYEIALYWGVMTAFQAWVDRAPKLSDLTGDEALPWNKDVRPTTIAKIKSDGYGYARYDCGVANTELVNIHPSATAWWILEKIARQAGFGVEMPWQYESALRAVAVPCLHKNASPESWNAEKTFVSTYCRTIRQFLGMDPNTGGAYMAYAVGYFNVNSSTQTLPVYIGNSVPYKYFANWEWSTDGIRFPVGKDETTVYMAEYSTLSLDEMEITIDALSVNLAKATCIEMHVRKEGEKYPDTTDTAFKTWKIQTGQIIRETIDCSSFDKYYFILKNPTQESAAYVVNIEITPHSEEMAYPSVFRMIPNLPEISQIDFIKAICAMFGLFVVPDPADVNRLKFVSLDVLQQNKAQARDWSAKLVRSNDDEPKTVEYKINDYCRNNYFKYKEDERVAVNADGNLKVASEVLEAEKTVITLPFAPSDGSKIPHYALTDDGTGVDAVQVKDRIMRLVGDASGLAALTFEGLDFGTLLAKHYATLSRLLDKAVTTTEQIMLDEYDLKSLDWAIPFYLRQYGKFYGVVSVQSAAGKACEVKAVQLPETVVVEPERPSQTVTIGWRVKANESAVYITASAPPASDLEIAFTHYTYEGEASARMTVAFPAGQTEVFAMNVTRMFGWIEVNSVTPEYDDTYTYIIAEQTSQTE